MAICIVAGTAAAVVWYLFFLRYNRRQGERAVARIQAALAGSGQIVAVRWLGPSIFQVALRLGTSLFQHSELMVRLAPRQNPVRWLRQWWRREPATVTFEADLDIPPGFNLQVGQHRWCGPHQQALLGGPRPLGIRASDAAHPDLAPELAAGSHRHDECPAQLPRSRSDEPRLSPHLATLLCHPQTGGPLA